MGDEEPPSVDPHLLLKIYVPEFDFLGGAPHAPRYKIWENLVVAPHTKHEILWWPPTKIDIW